MMTSPLRQPCTRGPLISVEGIPGVGKTYLTSHAIAGLDRPPLILDGLSQRSGEQPDLGIALLRALRATSGPDPFLRGGAPRAEAFLLLAIKRHDLDTVLPELAVGRAVIEGRSIDTTAVCQAVQLHPAAPAAALDEAIALVHLAASFRPLPDLTILITDNASAAIGRAQQRDNRVLTPEQAQFVAGTCALYEQVAATDPARYRIVDRRSIGTQQATRQIRAWITEASTGLSCVPERWHDQGGCCMYCGHRIETVPA